MTRRPPISPLPDTLFPYWALFRSRVDLFPDHTGHVAGPITAQRPALPLRLVARPSKPVPLVVRPIAAAPSIQPLDFQSLDEPAPIAEQVGHYLPYPPRPIPLPGAAEHPTPPVISVPFGSSTVPAPEPGPHPPSGLTPHSVFP